MGVDSTGAAAEARRPGHTGFGAVGSVGEARPRPKVPAGQPAQPLACVVVSTHTDLEEGTTLTLDFAKLTKIAEGGHQVVPVAVQDADSGEVLIVAYANDEAVRATLERGQAVFYSTSRNELWHKGATSGDTLTIVDVRVNCEQNSLVYRVRLDGSGSCHTRNADGTARHGCYYRVVTGPDELAFVEE